MLCDNPIPKQLSVLETKIRQLCKRQIVAVICAGPPGVGKTYSVKRIAREFGIHPRWISARTVAGLVKGIWDHRNAPLVVNDDIDTVWRSEAAANIFKVLLSPDGARIVRYHTKEIIKNAESDEADPTIPLPQFPVVSGYALFSNIDFENPTAILPAMRPHVSALESRGGIIRVSRDPRHLYDFTLGMASKGMLTRQREAVTWEEAKDAVAFFVQHRFRLREAMFSPRGLVQIARERRLDPAHWRETLEFTVLEARPVRWFDTTGIQTELTRRPAKP
jgi:hypothetical protein